jgi:pseudaminic acid biosynthesis-associated methylase
MAQHSTDQEDFWAGEFGDSYVERNANMDLLARKTSFLAKALAKTEGVKSAIEFGANIGLNLHALRTLFPEISLGAVEINEKAYKKLCTIPAIKAFNESIFNFSSRDKYSLTISCGVMIHTNPEFLPVMYDVLYSCSSKYILVAEYYNPVPVTVPYRGHGERLFKRDFAGEMLDRFPDLSLVDYGFIYHRDPAFPLDDLTWFLLQKRYRD